MQIYRQEFFIFLQTGQNALFFILTYLFCFSYILKKQGVPPMKPR